MANPKFFFVACGVAWRGVWTYDVPHVSHDTIRHEYTAVRKLRREEEARRVAEEKAKSLQETARTCASEVAELRKRHRVLEVKNADLRSDVFCGVVRCYP